MPRSFDTTTDDFPFISPTVSFVGPIVGSGVTLLNEKNTPGLTDTQRKCCGFIQLSTFLSPGNPTKTPFKGFHPFQVFVIFPIHANPWNILCKKMAERKESQFQPNTFLSCTGKVAGFLNHDTMVHPPQPTEDYVFIVVPDAWKFHDKTPRESFSISPSSMTVGKKSPADPHGRKEFQSPPKRTTPSKRSNESQNPTAVSTPQKKARIVPSEEQSSIITSEAPLDPSPGPHQHTDPPMQMKEEQEPISPPKGATPSKRSNECHSPTAISTPPKKVRTVPSEDLLHLHDSNGSSIITLEEPLDPSPKPHQHTDPSMQMDEK